MESIKTTIFLNIANTLTKILLLLQ